MNVRFRLRSQEAVQSFLKTVPYGGLRAGLAALVEYIIGNSGHGLRHDEPQKYVSRKSAGYKTSQRMMRYLFAVGILGSDGHGGIILNRYHRTGETAAAWSYNMTNGGYGYTLRNDKAGAYWTRGEPGQTRQHAMAGRRTVSKVIADNMAGAIRAANAAVKRFLG